MLSIKIIINIQLKKLTELCLSRFRVTWTTDAFYYFNIQSDMRNKTIRVVNKGLQQFLRKSLQNVPCIHYYTS